MPRIATFNLENLDDSTDARPRLEERLPVLRPALLRLEADVLCLQEVNARAEPGRKRRSLFALEKLLEGTPYASFDRATSLGVTGRRLADHHNLAILSRWPIQACRSLRHNLVEPLDVTLPGQGGGPSEVYKVEWDRPLLHVSLELPGARALEVVNLHLRAPLAAPVRGGKRPGGAWSGTDAWARGFYLAALKRDGQALEARLLVDSFLDTDPAVLVAVCGDFNARERETPTRLLCSAVEDHENPALSPRELIDLSEHLPAARRYSVLHGAQRALYDHILVSHALVARFRGIWIHNEDLADLDALVPGEASPKSSHAPIVAEFDLD